MKIHSTTGMIATVLSLIILSSSAQPQGIAVVDDPLGSVRWHSDHVVYVAGLGEVKPGSEGSLNLTTNTLEFVGRTAEGAIPFNRIAAVSIGDERVATGGPGAKVARRIPIFGFGAAVGAVTNKTVDLLTVEYHDRNGGYHGTVFEVPKTQASLAQQQLLPLITPPPVVAAQPCSRVAAPQTILVAPIEITDVDLPSEYRVLLYEQLIEQLKVANGNGRVYRVGDASAPCAAKTLQLSVNAFKKGNEALRSSTGPVGLFVGGTSLRLHLSLTNTSGTVLFEKSLKESKHGDGDSLSVTRDLAKSVSKRLMKAKQFDTPTTL